MASVPVEIRGTLYDLQTKSARQVFIQGEAYRSDVSVGHPLPPGGGGGGGEPPGTWGGSGEPFPGYGLPGQPPGTWGGSGEPFPGWGLPKPPEGPPPTGEPDDCGFIKAPPEGGGWAYHEKYGWMLDPPAGAAQPKG